MGHDGAVWLTEMTADRVGRISLDGQVTEYPLPVAGGYPAAMVAGPGGHLWFTLNQTGAIASISVDGDYHERARLAVGAAPVGLTASGEAVWFVEIGGGRIGRCSAAGEVMEYPLWDDRARPQSIVADPAGGCWFTT